MEKTFFGRNCLLGLLMVLASFFSLPVAAASPESLAFDELYAGVSSRGLVLSDKLVSLDGNTVTIQGFMAPPLKPTINFFVLTAVPMSICPFCSTDADWPDNIIVVNLSEPVVSLPFDSPIQVTGRLLLGSEVDPDTGFVSQIRIQAEDLSQL